MHDVDLIPINSQLRYSFPEEGNALHIASPQTHPKYHYDNFVGGILILTCKDFLKLNGLSNRYWGWGLEDDEFYLRMKQGGIKVIRPENITTGPKNTFKWVYFCCNFERFIRNWIVFWCRHLHDSVKRSRDMAKCFDQKAVTRKRDRVTGLKDVSYELQSVTLISINSSPATVLNVLLNCNRTLTPWCRCSWVQASTYPWVSP